MYTIVNIMKMNACSVIIKMWKIAQGTDNAHWIQNGNNAIRMKINSPAYMLPNSRRANETGRAEKVVNSNNKLNGIKSTLATALLELNGLSANSPTKPPTPFSRILQKMIKKNTEIDIPRVTFGSVVGTILK